MCKIAVTTLRVVWIEILYSLKFRRPLGSPPCGWCGLKSDECYKMATTDGHHLAGGVDVYKRQVYIDPCIWANAVEAFAASWIEISSSFDTAKWTMVEAFAASWIEIYNPWLL